MYCDLPTNEIADGHLTWESPEVQAHIRKLLWMEWYEDAEGYLYIVGDNADEIFGPDNEMADRIAEELRRGNYPWELEHILPELTYVDYILRRFTPEDGFYRS